MGSLSLPLPAQAELDEALIGELYANRASSSSAGAELAVSPPTFLTPVTFSPLPAKRPIHGTYTPHTAQGWHGIPRLPEGACR